MTEQKNMESFSNFFIFFIFFFSGGKDRMLYRKIAFLPFLDSRINLFHYAVKIVTYVWRPS